MREEDLIERLAAQDHARAVAVVDANQLGRIPVYTPDGPVPLVASWAAQEGKEEFRASGRLFLEELAKLGLHPLRVPSVTLQQLCDEGFNCFAVKLLVESFRRFPDAETQGIAFEIGGVRLALTPAAERKTEIDDAVTLRFTLQPPEGAEADQVTAPAVCGGCQEELYVAYERDDSPWGGRFTPAGIAELADAGWAYDGISWACQRCRGRAPVVSNGESEPGHP